MKRFSQIPFKQIDIEKIQNDFSLLIDEFKNANSFEEQDNAFKKINKYSDEIQTNLTVGEIRYTVDTTSRKNQKNQESIDENSPLISVLYNKFDKELVKAKFRDELEKKYGSHLFRMTEVSLESFDEKIVPELQEQNKLTSEYTKLISSAQIEFKGGTYNLTQMGKFTRNVDRKIRSEASILVAKFFEDNCDAIGEIYDKLVKLRNTMAKKLGYDNFVELGYKLLARTDYNSENVANYRKQIYEDLVPLTNKLFKEQAKRIGEKNPQFYDYNIMFKSGNPKPIGDTKYKLEMAQKMYDELSPETSFFFNFLCKYELMDLEAKPGKSSGGYMTYLPKYKAPFIFANFNGTSGDVDVLTHEFGHAFQGYMSKNIQVPALRSPTLEACEIHSMSMEFITHPWMKNFFGEDDKKYEYYHLADALCFIPYGAAIDEFQHFVYENPEVSHKERMAKFREIEKKYLPHIKYDEAPVLKDGGYWMRQGHLFGSPFYYIDYTLAQVVAFQFFVEDVRNHKRTWNKYVKLCKMGGKFSFTELLEKSKLNNPFVDGTIKKIVKPLKKELQKIDISNY